MKELIKVIISIIIILSFCTGVATWIVVKLVEKFFS